MYSIKELLKKEKKDSKLLMKAERDSDKDAVKEALKRVDVRQIIWMNQGGMGK